MEGESNVNVKRREVKYYVRKCVEGDGIDNVLICIKAREIIMSEEVWMFINIQGL
jgi:hypothetical protein